MGSTSTEEMWGTGFAGSSLSPPSLGRERAAVDVDVCPERKVGFTENTAMSGAPTCKLMMMMFMMMMMFITITARD